ncbi:MAG: hypothetical protein GYB35_13615 [Algicola sp.]|nr:hypothetical protein [Algicola sp.]
MIKTNLILIALVSLIFFSCSSDSNDSESDNPTLSDFPSQISIREYDSFGNSVDFYQFNLFYEENKLLKIVDGTFETNLSYTNSKLTRIESPFIYIILDYENDILSSYEIHDKRPPGYELIYRVELNYNQDFIFRDYYFLNESLGQDFIYSNTQEMKISQGNILYNYRESDQYTYSFNFGNNNGLFKNLNSLRELGIIQTGFVEINHRFLHPGFHFFTGNNIITSMEDNFDMMTTYWNYENIFAGDKASLINMHFDDNTNIKYRCEIEY